MKIISSSSYPLTSDALHGMEYKRMADYEYYLIVLFKTDVYPYFLET